MICCLFSYSTDAGYIKLTVEISSASPEAAGRNFPFSSLFAQVLGFSFGFGPASACRSPEGICSLLRQDSVKGAADSGLWFTEAEGREEFGMQGEPVVSEACVTLQQPEACRAFSPQSPQSPPTEGLPSVWKPFLLHSSLSLVQVPSLFFCLCFSFFLLPYPGSWGSVLPFGKSEVFC